MTDMKDVRQGPYYIPSTSEPLVRIVYGLFAVAGIAAIIVLARYVLLTLPTSDLATIIERHGPAVIGIPIAIAMAFILVGIVRAVEGPIRLEILGVKSGLAGAAALVWIVTFCAITVAIRALW